MMVFSEQKASKPAKKRQRKPKRWVIIGAFILLLGFTWWVLQPSNNSAGPNGSSSTADGAGTITGTLTGSDGQTITTAEIKVADSQGNAVNSIAVNQSGQFQLFLPNGTYIFSINAKGQQLIKQVRVDQNSPKNVDIQLDVPGGS